MKSKFVAKRSRRPHKYKTAHFTSDKQRLRNVQNMKKVPANIVQNYCYLYLYVNCDVVVAVANVVLYTSD